MKIVTLDGHTLASEDISWKPVAELGELTVFDRTSPEQLLERAGHADILITNKVVIDGATFSRLGQLKFIAVAATGFNVVDVDAARAAGIVVSNVPVYGTAAVAQHVFACLLSFIHRPELHSRAVHDGAWIASEDFCFWLSPITELGGKTMGIVGFGRIGQATAKLAQAFGMNVIVHSRTERQVTGLESVRWASLEKVFQVADVVSLHCPQTPENPGFVNAELIGQMKPRAILINTARGGLVNETDLAEALNSGVIGGACLDVISEEPMREGNPLLHAKHCLITPHNAWAAVEARQRLMTVMAENIQAFQNGQPINVVN